MFRNVSIATLSLILLASQAVGAQPAVGDKAADFSLSTPAGATVSLSGLLKSGPAVVVVLRGYPGYQCPICTQQVASLIGSAKEIADTGANVVLVYPGPVGQLKEKAQEFLEGTELPGNFHFVIDPGYEFTSAYGLRWDAVRETAYPSVIVVGKDGKISFAHISDSHGNRASTDDVVKALK
jgi:peroxiredoxin Q/BCP